MRKYLLGITAIVLAVVFSSFTSRSRNVETNDPLNWFEISGSYLGDEAVNSGDATFITRSATAPSVGCSESTHQCISGFTDSQITTGNKLDGSQLPTTVAEMKN
jgi:hypothetical protein